MFSFIGDSHIPLAAHHLEGNPPEFLGAVTTNGQHRKTQFLTLRVKVTLTCHKQNVTPTFSSRTDIFVRETFRHIFPRKNSALRHFGEMKPWSVSWCTINLIDLFRMI